MLARDVAQHQQGDVVEPITYPGYTVASRKRKRKEQKDHLDKTLAVGRFVILDIPNDDSNYKLRLGLGRITAVYDSYIEFQWYRYRGYPKQQNPTYRTTWTVQVLAGKGQVVDTGWCYTSAVVLTFPALTKGKKIPNTKRDAPMKMLTRALDGSFGPLPQDVSEEGSDSEYSDSGANSSDENMTTEMVVTRSRKCRGKRRAKP